MGIIPYGYIRGTVHTDIHISSVYLIYYAAKENEIASEYQFGK